MMTEGVLLVCNKQIHIIFENLVPVEYLCYVGTNFCITTGMFEFDVNGDIITDEEGNGLPIGMNIRKELSAAAYEAARVTVQEENVRRYLNGEDYLTEEEFIVLFKTELIKELKKRMTGVAVSTGSCLGDVDTGSPYYDFFGICIPGTCSC